MRTIIRYIKKGKQARDQELLVETGLRETQKLGQSSSSTTGPPQGIHWEWARQLKQRWEVRTQWRCFIAYLTISFKDLKNICAIKLADVFLIFFFIILMLNFRSSVHDHDYSLDEYIESCLVYPHWHYLSKSNWTFIHNHPFIIAYLF